MSDTVITGEQTLFAERLEHLYQEKQGTDSLSHLRAKAWQRYLKLGLPTRKSEAFRRTYLRSMYRHPLLRTVAACKVAKEDIAKQRTTTSPHLLVFINGVFSEELSTANVLTEKVVMLPLNQASVSYGPLLQETTDSLLALEENPFTLVNQACQEEGLFLYVPPSVEVEEPVEVLHLLTGKGEFALPRLQLFLGKKAKLSVAMHTAYLGAENSFFNGALEVIVEQEASLSFAKMLEKAPEDALHFFSLRARLHKKSHLKAVSLSSGASCGRDDFFVQLLGEEAVADLSGLCALKESFQMHTQVTIEHVAPHTTSHQLFKGVHKDTALSSFDGRIVVGKEALKTEAYQLNKNLLLEGSPKAYSRPNLKIFADDVKASHGATLGQLPAEDLFYFSTRCCEPALAKTLLLQGFCGEVIERVNHPIWQSWARAWLD